MKLIKQEVTFCRDLLANFAAYVRDSRALKQIQTASEYLDSVEAQIHRRSFYAAESLLRIAIQATEVARSRCLEAGRAV